MNKDLKVLLDEDSDVDAELIFSNLSEAGIRKENRTLKERLQKYQVFVEKANDAMFLVDDEGNILEVNDAAIKIYGYTYEEFGTMKIFDLRRTDDKRFILEQMESAGKEGIVFEMVHCRKDGTAIPVEVSSQGTFLGGKRVLLSIVRNITERKSVEKEIIEAKNAAEAADTAKSAFLANMSHEIRTPLNGIMGMAQLMKFTELNDEQKNNLNIIIKCSNSLVKIINDILDLSKIEADTMITYNEDFNINKLVDELHSLFANSLKEKNLELMIDIDFKIPVLLNSDASRLKQIIDNIVENAIKFTDKGRILLKIEFKDKVMGDIQLEVSVFDTGIGISEDEICHLFKPFSQVDSSLTRKYGGNGLGLAICKKLVNKNGGEIWVESEKGKGSRFAFTYYVKEAMGEVENTNKETEKFYKIRNNLKALVVDDDSVSSEFLKKVLKEMGVAAVCAFSGEEALDTIKTKHFDMIFMDIVLPGISGIDVLQRIRGIEKDLGAHTLVIAATASAMMGKKEEYLAVGMDGYIEKPIKVDELQNILKFCNSKLIEKDDLEYQQVLNSYFKLDIDTEFLGVEYIYKELEAELTSYKLTGGMDFLKIEKLSHELKLDTGKKANKVLEKYSLKIEFAARVGDAVEIERYIKAIAEELLKG